MIPEQAPPALDANEEVSELIETLHRAGQRLEELTAGEIDTVATREGRAYMLPHAQERIRHDEAARKTAILNALPAHIALIDIQGFIVSVNDAWHRFGTANAFHGPAHGVGADYLGVCDRAHADGAFGAAEAAAGIRAVLAGSSGRFSIEYPCDSPTEHRWFLMTVTPLGGAPPDGAVVMHLDITEKERAEQELLASERRFSEMLEHVHLISVMLDRDAKLTYCNEYFLRLTGWKREEALGADWFERFMPPELGDMKPVFIELLNDMPSAWHRENEIYTRHGERRLIRWNNSVLRSVTGEITGVASIGEDITEQRANEDALRQSEERTRSIVELALDAVVVMDATGRIVDWNTQAEKTFGWPRDEVVGTLLSESIIPPRYREAHMHGLHAFLETGSGPILGTRREIAALHRDGHEFPVELAISPLRLAHAWVFSAFIRDLTDRKEAERKITRLNRIHAVLSSINALIVRVRDRGELFKEACRIAVDEGRFLGAWIGIVDRPSMRLAPVASSGVDAAFLGGIQDRLMLRDDARLGHGAAVVAFLEKRAVVVNDVQVDPLVFHKGLHADNGIRAIMSLPLLINGEALGVFCLHAADAGVFDEAEVKLLSELVGDIAYAVNYIDKQERLDYLAYYDVITGLANRNLFLERVGQYMRSAAASKHGLGLFLFDLERFKSINDSLGQAAGDALLKQVADWLTRSMGDANLVARLGSDHFALVLPKIKAGGNVTALLERALTRFLEHSFHLDDVVLRLAAKVGVALYPEDGSSADTLLQHAEAALKAAKAGGDRYLYYAQRMTEASAGTLTLENQLRQAIERHEFVLHFQPKVNLATGELTGAEALIRWNDPRTGLVAPGLFIPVLEQTGMIHEVGRWALRAAVEEYRRWRTAGLPAVPIAVNVSPLQLRSRRFTEEVRSAIGNDLHAAAGLELEITESLIMEDVKHSITSLQAIRAMGVRIAIDDFGTGFSSLSYLAKLPVDTLKIDRAFVVDMATGPQGRALVATIITLAHSLKLKVVAEGVETEEQSALLREMVCDEVQGYLFGRPVPAAEFEALRLARR